MQRVDAAGDGSAEFLLQSRQVLIDAFERQSQLQLTNGGTLGSDIGSNDDHVGVATCRIQDPICRTTTFPLLH